MSKHSAAPSVTYRSIRSTLISVAIVILLLAQRYAGFVLFLLALPLVPWLLYSVCIIVTKPARRTQQAVKAAIWVLAVVTVIGIHYGLHVSTRASADEVVSAIRKYSDEHGGYPPNLRAIGLSDADLRAKLGMSRYGLHSGQPFLSYASTFEIFAWETYDFENRRWEHRSS
jgi:hypothetical protein